MERSERIGMMVSGGAHLGAILWLLIGGVFFSHDMPPPVATAEVSLMSQSDYDAMVAAAPKAATEAPPQPSLPEPPASDPVPPAPEPKPEAKPQPRPEPQPEPDPSPDLTELTPPDAQVEDKPPTPPAPPIESSAEVVTPEAQPKPADIVAPDPTEAPEQPADVAPDAVAETAPDPTAEPKPEPETEAAAPKETGDVLKTEDNKDKVASAAPPKSVRPKSKPPKPAPAEETKPAEEPAQETTETAAAAAPTETPDAAVNDALAEALAGEASEEPSPGTGTADSGPPMTGGEKDALVIAVKQCWNVGSLSTDALNTVVTVGVSMDQSGKPVTGSIKMIGYEGGSEASAKQAYEAGRRAIIRCGQNGFPLPPEKYAQWQEVEITFDPQQMRMR